MTSVRRHFPGGAAAFLSVLAALSAASTVLADPAPEITALRPLVVPGETAPPFTLKTLEGKTVAFRPGNGKPSLIVFWSAFCPLCREMTPAINDIVARQGPALRFASVNLDGVRFTNAVRSFVRENGIRYPVFLDALQGDFFVASDRYGVEKTPTAVLVDGRGKVHSAWAADRIKGMVQAIDAILIGLDKADGAKK